MYTDISNEELVSLYKQGDVGALETLIKENKGLIYKVSKKFYTKRDNAIEEDDLLQEGRIGLIKAANKYEQSMGSSFSSYAYYWIYQCMYRFLYPKRNMVNSKIRFVSLNTPIDEEIELGDTLVDESLDYCEVEDSIYHQELKKELEQAMEERLNEQQRLVIYSRSGFDGTVQTLKQISEVMNLSLSRVGQLETESLRKLRNSKWGRKKHIEMMKERYA